MIQPYGPSVNLRSNDTDDKMLLVYSEIKLNYGAFPRAAPRIWNKLPLAIRQSRTLEKFKKELKPHYFIRNV